MLVEGERGNFLGRSCLEFHLHDFVFFLISFQHNSTCMSIYICIALTAMTIFYKSIRGEWGYTVYIKSSFDDHSSRSIPFQSMPIHSKTRHFIFSACFHFHLSFINPKSQS